MFSDILNKIVGVFMGSDNSPPKRWETVYDCQLTIVDAATKQLEKSWSLELQVAGDDQRINGREPDVDLLKHPCYTSVIKPWFEKEDFVVLKQGGFYHFQDETYYPTIQSFVEKRGQSMESMNMDELEMLVDGLNKNQQPQTVLGQFAIEYALTIQQHIDSSKAFVDNYFTRGKDDQSESGS